MAIIDTRLARKRRHARVREKIKGTEERPRLVVFRSLNNMYAHIVDDVKGHVLVAASTLESRCRDEAENSTKSMAAAIVGKQIAQKALDKGIREVVFDRGGYKYHGRTKALAEAAREVGLVF